MDPIVPRKLADMPPEEILRLPPCMDLDKFVLDRVLEGPVELLEETGVSVPMFSRNFGHAYPVLIKTVLDGQPITIHVDPVNFESAKAAGQIVRKTEVNTWRLEMGEYVGYGRSFPEAICKLAICKKFEIRGRHEKR